MRRYLAVLLLALSLLAAPACSREKAVEAPPPAALESKIASDYPDWTVASISRNGTEQYFVRLEHPDRELGFSVRYTQWPGYIFTSEQTVREGAAFPEGREELLDYLEVEYRDQGYSIGLIEAAPEGMVSVMWARTTRQIIFPVTSEGQDHLAYVEALGRWRRVGDAELGF